MTVLVNRIKVRYILSIEDQNGSPQGRDGSAGEKGGDNNAEKKSTQAPVPKLYVGIFNKYIVLLIQKYFQLRILSQKCIKQNAASCTGKTFNFKLKHGTTAIDINSVTVTQAPSKYKEVQKEIITYLDTQTTVRNFLFGAYIYIYINVY